MADDIIDPTGMIDNINLNTYSRDNALRITYLSKVAGEEGSGINKKIAAQVKEWRNQAAVVTPIFISKEGKLPSEIAGLGAVVIQQHTWVSRFVRDARLEKLVQESRPDAVYARMSSLPAFSVKKIFRYSVIVEINSRVFDELKVAYTGMRYYLLRLHFKYMLKRATGFVGVTKECLIDLPNKPSMQIGNPIDFDRALYTEVQKARSRSNICVFVGSKGCAWHGVDRLVNIAVATPDYHFWIVGYDKEYIERSIGKLLPKNVTAFGHVTGTRYEQLLRDASFAFGSLAMDRNNMKYSSSLKNRDYLQYALPIILQGTDSDISDLDNVFEVPYSYDIRDIQKTLVDISSRSGSLSDLSAIERSVGSTFIENRRLNFIRSFCKS